MIKRLESRYHLRAGEIGQKDRLDRLLAGVLDGGLEHALEKRGIDPRQDICVRRISCFLRPKLSSADDEVIDEWSLALAESIDRAVAGHSPSADVVVYRTRLDGFVDFAWGALAGDRGRAWAWNQLGFARLSQVASSQEGEDSLRAAFDREPEYVVPVISKMALSARFAPLCGRVHPLWWKRLAEIAVRRAGAGMEPADAVHQQVHRPSGGLTDRLESSLSGSQLARRLADRSTVVDCDPIAQRALTVLCILACEPTLLLGPPRATRVMIAEAMRLIFRRRPSSPGQVTAPQEAVSLGSQPGSDSAPLRQDDRPGGARSARMFPTSVGSGETGSLAPAGDSCQRQRGTTAMGGLFYILRVAAELKLHEKIAASGLCRRRSFRWAMHQLAVALCGVGERDPAALGFAALSLDHQFIGGDREPRRADEERQLTSWAREVFAHLRVLLRRPRCSKARLVRLVLGRHALVLVDPGWIEVRYSLRDASTDIRRAGLDLDPGYLPWLGAVVEFVYE